MKRAIRITAIVGLVILASSVRVTRTSLGWGSYWEVSFSRPLN